jgi:hypothetical protein
LYRTVAPPALLIGVDLDAVSQPAYPAHCSRGHAGKAADVVSVPRGGVERITPDAV